MAASCTFASFGTEDVQYLTYLCDAVKSAALGEVLGRAPTCLEPCPVDLQSQA